MAKNYTLDKDGKVTVLRFVRKLAFEDVVATVKEVGRIDDSNRRLWDLSRNVDLTVAELERLAEVGKSVWFEPSRVAYLAADDLTFGLLRMFEVFREEENYETRVFRSEDEALEWLHAWNG